VRKNAEKNKETKRSMLVKKQRN